jgi:calcineurin-like phosphoesterase family protein
MSIWFTSDTHFGHERIVSYCKRPFRDVDEMNETGFAQIIEKPANLHKK